MDTGIFCKCILNISLKNEDLVNHGVHFVKEEKE
jgi:hypothetical protein